MQLGFVIDHTRCIGCHACTVACKSENDVPVGDFRTWVKYTEEGAFPDVKRSFSVLRCNQCTDAPCVTICPVTALDKRPDGIVDVDHNVCIGCKACMQGCPYDALYINDNTGTAQKCHFCAHRTELGLAPACAVVCPTEAIIPGDFHDPASAVSKLREQFDLTVRKEEAGTGPNVMYRDVAAAGVDPLRTNAAGGYMWSNQREGPQLEAQRFEAVEEALGQGVDDAMGKAMEQRAQPSARTVYNVDRKPVWGGAITGYLFFKSLAAGSFLVGSLLLTPIAPLTGLADAAGLEAVRGNWRAPFLVPGLALVFLSLTLLLLVIDLKRPERFLSILLRPNWNSWLAKGSFVLLAYSVMLVGWLGCGLAALAPRGISGAVMLGLTAVLAALSAAYTGWLFRQAKGRVLWMKRGYPFHLLVQALVAGAAVLLAAAPLLDVADPVWRLVQRVLIGSLGLHLVLTLAEGRLAPPGREQEFHRAARLVTSGPFSRLHWLVGVLTGALLPLGLLLFSSAPGLVALAGALTLVGLWVEKDIFVRAGQALPIS